MLRKLLLLAGVAAFGITDVVAQTPTPYNTAVTNYVYIGAAGLNASTQPSKIYTSSNPAAATFSGGVNITGVSTKLNGMGVNSQDGFLYAIAFPNSAAVTNAPFYRLGSNGVAVNLGTIAKPNYPGATFSYINTTAGTIDGIGTYRFMAYAYLGNPSVIPYKADSFRLFLGSVHFTQLLSGNSPSTITPTYYEYDFQQSTAFKAAMDSFLHYFNYANPGSSNGGMEDLALNPQTGQLYSYFSYPVGNASTLKHRLVTFDQGGGSVDFVGTAVNSTPNREIAGAYTTQTGDIYVLFTDGKYGQVDPTTGVLTIIGTSNLPLQGTNLRGDLGSNVIHVDDPGGVES